MFGLFPPDGSLKPNMNTARPEDTTITCRPSTVNEIGAATVSLPRKTRQCSRPVVNPAQTRIRQLPQKPDPLP